MLNRDHHYLFAEEEKKSIIDSFGKTFFEKLTLYTVQYAEQWSLTNLQLVPSYSANVVFLCDSQQYGAAVLKIARSSGREYRSELHALQQYNGKGLCRLLQFDVEQGVMLIQQIQPGDTLRKVASLEQRLGVFCSIYQGLHISPIENVFPSYKDWVDRITDYISRQEQFGELYGHMKQAQRLYTEVSADYPRSMLLHGDLHHDNILLGLEGQYVVIDPKGVTGDPVFDIPRFILNEYEDELTNQLTEKMNTIIAYLERELAVPQHTIRRLLYIETTMGACWFVEDGITSEQYEEQLASVRFAQSLLMEA